MSKRTLTPATIERMALARERDLARRERDNDRREQRTRKTLETGRQYR